MNDYHLLDPLYKELYEKRERFFMRYKLRERLMMKPSPRIIGPYKIRKAYAKHMIEYYLLYED